MHRESEWQTQGILADVGSVLLLATGIVPHVYGAVQALEGT